MQASPGPQKSLDMASSGPLGDSCREIHASTVAGQMDEIGTLSRPDANADRYCRTFVMDFGRRLALVIASTSTATASCSEGEFDERGAR